jgi:hypothetical protein
MWHAAREQGNPLAQEAHARKQEAELADQATKIVRRGHCQRQQLISL